MGIMTMDEIIATYERENKRYRTRALNAESKLFRVRQALNQYKHPSYAEECYCEIERILSELDE